LAAARVGRRTGRPVAHRRLRAGQLDAGARAEGDEHLLRSDRGRRRERRAAGRREGRRSRPRRRRTQPRRPDRQKTRPCHRRGRRSQSQMSGAPPVAARALVKRYGEIVAVDHVDLTVERGDVFGYLGPNGAGKTTSLRMLLGLIRPTEGSAQLFGRDPVVDGARALDGVAGFVEGPRFYPYLSGRKNLRLLADYDGGEARSRIDEALDVV